MKETRQNFSFVFDERKTFKNKLLVQTDCCTKSITLVLNRFYCSKQLTILAHLASKNKSLRILIVIQHTEAGTVRCWGSSQQLFNYSLNFLTFLPATKLFIPKYIRFYAASTNNFVFFYFIVLTKAKQEGE